MKIQKYKPGKGITSTETKNKNNYYQYYWNDTKLWSKGYVKNGKYIGYKECYIWRNKGLKYKI
jgi:hypothetical protein